MFRARSRRHAGVLGSTAVLTGLGLAASAFAGPLSPAAVAAAPSTVEIESVNAVPLATAQTNGTVYGEAYAAGRLWLGGTFTTLRPAGVAAGGAGQRTVTDIAVLTAPTGAISSISHVLKNTYNGAAPIVYAVRASADGSTVYIGGDFNSVDGVAQQHLAAFNATTGALIPAFGATGVNGRVLAIAMSGSTVYAGGTFTKAGSLARLRLAALSTAGKVLPLAASVAGTGTTGQASAVYALDVAAAGNRLYLGGTFDTVNGVATHGLASIDPVTGATQTWNARAVPAGSYVTTITHDATREYVAARDNTTQTSARFEGVKALDPATGSQLWFDACFGDTFALLVLGGDVYVATHAHDCSAIGGWPESTPRHYASVYAVTADTGALTSFLPTMSGSAAVPGSQDMPRAFATDGTSLWVGGGFVAVNGLAQQDLVRYSPNGPGAAPAKPFAVAGAPATGGVSITWKTVADPDTRWLKYSVYKNSSTTNPLYTTNVDSAFWLARTLTFQDTSAVAGTPVHYRVSVTDGTTTVWSPSTATVTPTARTPAARTAVRHHRSERHARG